MNAIIAMGRPAAGVSLRERLAFWRERRAARLQIERELNNHTDRQLAELGLSRHTVRHALGVLSAQGLLSQKIVADMVGHSRPAGRESRFCPA